MRAVEILQSLKPDGQKVVSQFVELSRVKARTKPKLQFAGFGYLVADREIGVKLVFNRVKGLKISRDE